MTDQPNTEPPFDCLVDPVVQTALDAATEQFCRMPTSNCWDYAQAVVRTLRKEGYIDD